jgi:hypothetical protein
MLLNHHPSPLPSPHHWPIPTMVDSQTSPTDDNNSPLPPPPPPIQQQQQAPLKPNNSRSISVSENQELKQKAYLNNQTAVIVVAKYSYEPLQFSPNDHPEVELPLNVGEYYLIYGDVDEVNNLYLN